LAGRFPQSGVRILLWHWAITATPGSEEKENKLPGQPIFCKSLKKKLSIAPVAVQ